MNRIKASSFAAAAALCITLDAHATLVNYALNPAQAGLPNPLQSDPGWGGGAVPWELVDGLKSYDFWAHGLAFTGGHTSTAGGGPWIQPAGVRQATIDLGIDRTFEEVVIWHHGVEHTPQTPTLQFWTGVDWENIAYQRLYGTMHEDGSNSGYSDSDIYTFAPVTGSKVRYSFDNSGLNIDGTFNIHGWIYEFEVFGQDATGSVPEPATALLLGIGLLGMTRLRRNPGNRAPNMKS